MKRRLFVSISIILLLLLVGCENMAYTNDNVTFSSINGNDYYYASLESGKIVRLIDGWFIGQCSFGADQYIGYYESINGSYLAIFDKKSCQLEKLIEVDDFVSNQTVCISSDHSDVFYLIKNEGVHKYSITQNKDEIFYSIDTQANDSFCLSNDLKKIYYLNSVEKNLYCIDLNSNTNNLLCSKVEAFDVSEDESFMVYNKHDVQDNYYYFDLASGEERLLFITKYPSRTIDISNDNSNVLFIDYKEGAFFSDNRKPIICTYSFNTGKTQRLYMFKNYGDVVESVHWSE